MTDKPKTLALDQHEWAALLTANSQRLVATFGGNPTPTIELVQQVGQHLERMYNLLPAWLSSVVPAGTSVEQVLDAAEKYIKSEAVVAASNGVDHAAMPKKRGRPRKDAAAMQ